MFTSNLKVNARLDISNDDDYCHIHIEGKSADVVADVVKRICGEPIIQHCYPNKVAAIKILRNYIRNLPDNPDDLFTLKNLAEEMIGEK